MPVTSLLNDKIRGQGRGCGPWGAAADPRGVDEAIAAVVVLQGVLDVGVPARRRETRLNLIFPQFL